MKHKFNVGDIVTLNDGKPLYLIEIIKVEKKYTIKVIVDDENDVQPGHTCELNFQTVDNHYELDIEYKKKQEWNDQLKELLNV